MIFKPNFIRVSSTLGKVCIIAAAVLDYGGSDWSSGWSLVNFRSSLNDLFEGFNNKRSLVSEKGHTITGGWRGHPFKANGGRLAFEMN